MVHINATVSFNKTEDSEKLELCENLVLTYNMMASCCGVQMLDVTKVDCGDTVELKIDQDYDTTTLANLEKTFNLLESTSKDLF